MRSRSVQNFDLTAHCKLRTITSDVTCFPIPDTDTAHQTLEKGNTPRYSLTGTLHHIDKVKTFPRHLCAFWCLY